MSEAELWRIRMQAARALGKFNNSQAVAAINKLREVRDYSVVGVVLEASV
ncbi:hypothetical protein [Myxosarcina sp. GI1(2024)]